jgi:anti-sigma factor RsiW
VAQHSNEHLTTAQLSAYLDKELAPGELALCDAHLQTCQICQSMLADLRLTSAMLRNLPQAEVPRSFVLPTNIAVLPQRPARAEQQTHQPARSRSIWKSTLRSLSTLAAVLGLLFLLVGALSALPFPHSGANSSVMAPSNSQGLSQPASAQSSVVAGHVPPSVQQTNVAAGRASPSVQQTPDNIPTPANAQTPGEKVLQTPNQQPTPPAILDIGTPEGRLGIGAILLLLGIFGAFLTRRSKYEYPH